MLIGGISPYSKVGIFCCIFYHDAKVVNTTVPKNNPFHWNYPITTFGVVFYHPSGLTVHHHHHRYIHLTTSTTTTTTSTTITTTTITITATTTTTATRQHATMMRPPIPPLPHQHVLMRQ